MYGSRTVFAQQPPRDEGRMKRHLRSTGLFPKAGKNHDKVLQEQLAKIQAQGMPASSGDRLR